MTPKDGKICAAYTITHLMSGCVYIGSTSDIYQRVHNHKSQLRKGAHHCKRFQELYDQSDVITWTYYLTDTREEAYRREQEMIDHNKGKSTLLNVAMDVKKPALGAVRSELARALLSVHRKGKKLSAEHVEKVRKANTGKKRTPEQCEAIRIRTQGVPKPEHVADNLRSMNETRKKKLSINGVIYESLSAAARALNMPKCTVAQRLKSQNFTAWFAA
jgi:group I intron endonuclease